MGLNLDINHVAFSGTVKFDGRRHRHLTPAELAQIAGRAGRYMTDGTFGVTGEASPLDPEEVEAIESHRFPPLNRLQWRSAALDFASPGTLIASLERGPDRPDLQRAREADDLATLKELAAMPDVGGRLRHAADTRLLWDVCQIPDFRKVSLAEHASLCVRIFRFLHEGRGIPTDWLARQIERIDRTDGDIDALSKRLAYIRTWTYVAQRPAWIDDADHWRDETRAVEDRLSDALHVQLTQRFVDRRTSVLMRRLKQRESLVATVNDNGEVTIDDQFVGRLEGFVFRFDPSADADQARTLRAAGIAALAPALSLRADKFYNAPDAEIDVTEQGGLMWGEHAVGKLVAGADALSPQVQPFVDEDADPAVAERVKRRLGHWIDRKTAALFQPLVALRDDESLTGMARGIAFRLVEALGVLPRAEISEDVKALDQEGRASLRKHGVRFGQYTVFQPLLLKPAPTRLRLVLWSLASGLEVFPEAPPPGVVTVAAVKGAPAGYYPHAGYRLAGERAIRIDMLERLADLIRNLDARGGFEATPDMLSITGLTLEQFAKLMQGLGYQATEGTRPKRKPAPAAAAAAPPVEAAAVEAGAPEVPSEPPVTPEPDRPDSPAELPPAPGPDLPEPPAELPPAPGPDLPVGEPVEVPGRRSADVPGTRRATSRSRSRWRFPTRARPTCRSRSRGPRQKPRRRRRRRAQDRAAGGGGAAGDGGLLPLRPGAAPAPGAERAAGAAAARGQAEGQAPPWRRRGARQAAPRRAGRAQGRQARGQARRQARGRGGAGAPATPREADRSRQSLRRADGPQAQELTGGMPEAVPPPTPPSIRLDKWLWQARFCKSRALAARLVGDGAVRLNAQRVTKPATPLRVGDGLSFAQGGRVRSVRVLRPRQPPRSGAGGTGALRRSRGAGGRRRRRPLNPTPKADT